MNWKIFAKMIVKTVNILNIIRKTADEQGLSLEHVLSQLDEKHGMEALEAASKIFAGEIKRLNDGPEYEIMVSPNPMTKAEAVAWESSVGDGWKIPDVENHGANHFKAINEFCGRKRHWEEMRKYRADGYIWLGMTRTGTGGIEPGYEGRDVYACLVRELPPKTWHLVRSSKN
jgi:hypothetical protein